MDKVHDKVLLISGKYAGSTRKLVWTGSHNWTGNALRYNDEAMLRIDEGAVFNAYLNQWNKIWALP